MTNRLHGVITAVHMADEDDPRGGYGTIEGDDGRRYVYQAGVFYRDGTSPEMGLRVWFDATGEPGIYATKISRHR
jgi:hypothetical protein